MRDADQAGTKVNLIVRYRVGVSGAAGCKCYLCLSENFNWRTGILQTVFHGKVYEMSQVLKEDMKEALSELRRTIPQ